ncbi:MAG: hypothetical protein M0Q93_08345 [Terrimicrobiaceae bacterium]|jgi:hypothetical protein|nr:hypothetical protein [Terrimicrobiaceae bacterium]
MSFLRQSIIAIALVSVCSAIEIDPKEKPLLTIRFPFSDTVDSGSDNEVLYVLLKSGIGYSVFRVGQKIGGSGFVGSFRNRHTFWLEQGLIDAVVAQAISAEATKATVPPSRQMIIEGTAIEGGKKICSWNDRNANTLKILTFLGGVRDDLNQHFTSEHQKTK